MLLFQLPRARNTMEYFSLFLKNLDLRIELQNVAQTMFMLIYILHVTGCFWNASTGLNIYTRKNWIRENELEDAGIWA